MEHVLDNPGWNALISGNSDLATGDNRIKYFQPEVSPFMGFCNNAEADFDELYQLAPQGRVFGYISDVATAIPAPWTVLASIACPQMIHNGKPGDILTDNVRLLTDADIPQMLALTKLTAPGPFAERTIEFGHYYGIFDGDKLVAMAGQRLHIFNYAEISAVCTHPDYLGRGYAKQLLQFHVNRIIAAEEVPILHVRHDNARAIAVYESLGFATRKLIYFHIIKK
ncbi:GNAT family N-acetyltransferase [Mucilaginibacter pedocola]|uniref:N-acetyltransferase domain-containing protein n=1 Tax=Mucilaginibacter pedocola TaxID=1792845 RepID=A0A1S9PKG0_9SPHI|nr:GNAT family N-acetyltransferase [Mucilaginibacter pedocola]OOQ61437.1 hypothetical protein BC343_20955 [Mucilaginibacter pedocola]